MAHIRKKAGKGGMSFGKRVKWTVSMASMAFVGGHDWVPEFCPQPVESMDLPLTVMCVVDDTERWQIREGPACPGSERLMGLSPSCPWVCVEGGHKEDGLAALRCVNNQLYEEERMERSVWRLQIPEKLLGRQMSFGGRPFGKATCNYFVERGKKWGGGKGGDSSKRATASPKTKQTGEDGVGMGHSNPIMVHGSLLCGIKDRFTS
ncbi:hypothetical protein An13g00160 [Aspergillus niger]|uniref:Uncharacterized protein n=2 Tax=Aspergillus niger TaxID=5061 RepID=A2R168_ASPNC|nr:hypothetical protein An13g00160 [Aspergillus niger]CAK46418.1 hypothetical protein An13g00160 [Aspergillus niger]